MLFATQTLHVSVRGYGLLLASSAVGGVIGGLVNPALARRHGPVPLLVLATCIGSAQAVGLGLAPNGLVLGAAMACGGFSTTLWNVVTVSMRQREVPADLFGRVNSVYRMLGWGTRPLGALVGGFIAEAAACGAVYRRGHPARGHLPCAAARPPRRGPSTRAAGNRTKRLTGACVEMQDRETRRRAALAPPVNSRHRAAGDDRLDEMVGGGGLGTAPIAADPHVQAGHDHAVSAKGARRLPQTIARTASGGADETGVGRHLGVPGTQGPELVVSSSSCSPATAMPSAIPAGTQPAMTSLAKSPPDSSVANGRASGAHPITRTAVPTTVNSMAAAVRLVAGISVTPSVAPTTPWPPRSAHSPAIRSSAVRRPSNRLCASRPAAPVTPVPVSAASGRW